MNSVYPLLCRVCSCFLAMLLMLSLSGCSQTGRYYSLRVGWKPNIKVLASSNQDDLSFFGMYAHALTENLRKPQISGLEEAQADLEKTGIPYNQLHFYPESTPRRELHSWQKNENKERFVLLIGGPSVLQNDSNGFSASDHPHLTDGDLETVKSALTDSTLYNVPEDHIQTIVPAGAQDLATGLAWIKTQLQSTLGAEGLIMFCCHGNQESSFFEMPWDGEGDAEGILALAQGGIKKSILKQWINSAVGDDGEANNTHPVLIIVLACHAGAFIAGRSPIEGST